MSTNITGISISSDIVSQKALCFVLTIQKGDISIKYDNAIGDDIFISITKYASKNSDADLFDDSFVTIDGVIYYTEVTNKPAGLKAVFGCIRSDIEVSLPYNMPQNIALTIKSENGNIQFTGLNPSMNTWSSANLQTTNGNINVNNVRNDNKFLSLIFIKDLVGDIVSLVTTNGNINVDTVLTGDVTMTTVNGNVEGDISLNSTFLGGSSACSLHASSVNGNLDVDTTVACTSSKVSMESVNGNVDSTAVGYSGNFDFEASNGKVTIGTQSPVTVTYTSNSNSDKEGAITGYESSGTYTLSTVNGNVKTEFN